MAYNSEQQLPGNLYFLDKMLDAVRAQRSIITVMILGQSMSANGHHMTLSESDLFEALVRKVEQWLPNMKPEEYVLLSNILAAIANLAVTTQSANNTRDDEVRRLYKEWQTTLSQKRDTRADNVVEDMELYVTNILGKGRADWSLLAV